MHTKPGLGDLQQAEFRGNVKFVNGTESTAEAQVGLYQVDQDRLDLSPSPTDPGPPPTVTNTDLTVHARDDLAEDGNAEAAGGYRRQERDGSEARRRPRPRGTAAGPAPSKLPSLLKQDQPVTIRSNRLEYDGGASRARVHGRRTPDTAGRDRAAGRQHRARRPVRQPHRPPQGPHQDDARRRRSEDQAAHVDRDHRHRRPFRLRGREASGHLHVDRDGAGSPGRPDRRPHRQPDRPVPRRRMRTNSSGWRPTAA